MVTQEHSGGPVRLRVALRYVGLSGFPAVVGWPLARIEIHDEVLVFAVPRVLPFRSIAGNPCRTVRRDKIKKIERTQYGVRFYADGFEDPWVIASIFPRRLLRRLAENGVVPSGPIVRSRWGTI